MIEVVEHGVTKLYQVRCDACKCLMTFREVDVQWGLPIFGGDLIGRMHCPECNYGFNIILNELEEYKHERY